MMAGAIFAGCKKEEEEKKSGTGTLNPASKQRALVVETTGAWCGWCPNGAELMTQEEYNFGSDMMPVAIHTGDDLETEIANVFDAIFPSSGVPNFYVGNEDSGQNIAGNIASLIAQSPMAGVGHSWNRSGNEVKIKSRVKFYEAGTGTYYVGAYFVQGDIEASGSLVQVDYTDRVEEINGVSKWKEDAAPVADGNGNQKYLIRSGDTYMHSHTLTSGPDDMDYWGEAIPVSPTANDQYTMDFTITISDTDVTEDMKILTVLWKDNDLGEVEFVNGYMK